MQELEEAEEDYKEKKGQIKVLEKKIAWQEGEKMSKKEGWLSSTKRVSENIAKEYEKIARLKATQGEDEQSSIKSPEVKTEGKPELKVSTEPEKKSRQLDSEGDQPKQPPEKPAETISPERTLTGIDKGKRKVREEKEYYYEAMDSTGEIKKDFIIASSEDEAQNRIREKEYFVTKFELGKDDNKELRETIKQAVTMEEIIGILKSKDKKSISEKLIRIVLKIENEARSGKSRSEIVSDLENDLKDAELNDFIDSISSRAANNLRRLLGERIEEMENQKQKQKFIEELLNPPPEEKLQGWKKWQKKFWDWLES